MRVRILVAVALASLACTSTSRSPSGSRARARAEVRDPRPQGCALEVFGVGTPPPASLDGYEEIGRFRIDVSVKTRLDPVPRFIASQACKVGATAVVYYPRRQLLEHGVREVDTVLLARAEPQVARR